MGASAALAPFIPLLESQAGGDAAPRRLILLFSPNGTLHERWAPTGSENDFQLREILQPLESYKSQMCILDGLRVLRDGVGDAHQKGMGCLWTGSPLNPGNFQGGGNATPAGWASSASIDQAIVRELDFPTPYASLEFGARTEANGVWSRMIYAGSDAPIAPENSPRAMFDRLFADLDVDSSELERIKAERRSVLDMVNADLQALSNRSSSADKLKIEAHLDAVREVEKRNDLGVSACEAPTSVTDIDPEANDNFPAVSRQMLDQLVLSLACDLTRVASLQWSRAAGQVDFNWLPGNLERHHALSHLGDNDPTMIEGLTTINRWYAEEVKYLLDQMSAIPEGNGTLLDNSLVVWGNELSRGNNHGNNPVPFVTFGGAGGRIDTGRWLTYENEPHNRLLVSLGKVMGADFDSFGSNDPSSGGLSGFYA